MEPFSTGNIYAKSEAEYRASFLRLLQTGKVLTKLLDPREVVDSREFCLDLYSRNPSLWFTLFSLILGMCNCENSDIFQPRDLQRQEIDSNQLFINESFVKMYDLVSVFVQAIILYSSTNMEVDAHPQNSFVSYVIQAADNLFCNFGGSEESLVKHEPNLLVRVVSCRRDAYRASIQSLGPWFLNLPFDSPVYLLYLRLFKLDIDCWDTFNVGLADSTASIPYRWTAPPPPAPSVKFLEKIVSSITSLTVANSIGSLNYLVSYLCVFLVRLREVRHVWVDPKSYNWSNTCDGFNNEPQNDCLSKENFNLENHLKSRLKSSW